MTWFTVTRGEYRRADAGGELGRPGSERSKAMELKKTLMYVRVAPLFRPQGDNGLNTGAPMGGDVAGEQGGNG
jgi:hypothetical protein